MEMSHFHITLIYFQQKINHFHITLIHFQQKMAHFHITMIHFQQKISHFHITMTHFQQKISHFHIIIGHFQQKMTHCNIEIQEIIPETIHETKLLKHFPTTKYMQKYSFIASCTHARKSCNFLSFTRQQQSNFNLIIQFLYK